MTLIPPGGVEIAEDAMHTERTITAPPRGPHLFSAAPAPQDVPGAWPSDQVAMNGTRTVIRR